MRILLTGSSGFIGSSLLKLLPINTLCIDLKTNQSLYDIEYLQSLFENNDIDVIIHLAAIPGVGYSMEHSQEVLTNNTIGFKNLAKLAIKHKVKHFIYASSSSVYGDEGEIKSPYALSKKINEMQAEMYSKMSSTKFTGLRFFTVYGPGIRKDLAISKFITAIRNDEPIHVYGDGLQSRDFTYVDDVCDAIIAIMNSDRQWTHEVFDVGYGESVTVNELISILKDILNPDYDKIVYEGEKSYDVKHTLSDTFKLYEWFGIKPSHSLMDGLNEWLNKIYKTCIITVVKNEQEYLDEWIRYHLNLGIDHIFIYEDIDSGSHKDICDKYKYSVTLSSISTVFNESEMKLAKEVKELNKYSIQHTYFRNGLNYIQKLNRYDWCFIIDNDEFITFENENDTLDNVLSLFEKYEAFTMSWKLYGANGLIHKPDYSKKGTIETYVNEAKGKIPNQVKTCYKLKTFKNEFLYSLHHPTDICNWCNTDYIKDYGNAVFSKIYLRHYITKSWEEFVWKRKSRGYIWGRERGFDYFFKINPDMLNKKNELMTMVKNDTLVVMPYKQSGAQGNEIRIALNAWKKFCQFEYKFVVIGEFDERLKNEFPWVRFIQCQSISKEGQYSPHLDIQNKFKAVLRIYAQEYDGFVYITDDEYAIKPFSLNDITKVHYHSKEFTGNKSAPTSYWVHDKWKTRQLLDRNGLPCINYTTHYPSYFEFKKLDEIWKRFDMFNESYEFDDVYYNYFTHEEPILDSEIRLGIWNKSIFENEFQNAVNNPNIKFMCNSVAGWSLELEKALTSIIEGKYNSGVADKKITIDIMTQNGNLFKAGEGKLIVRKADDFIMGDCIDLGSADSIDNYEEREFTEEEIDAFFKSVGVERPGKKSDKNMPEMPVEHEQEAE